MTYRRLAESKRICEALWNEISEALVRRYEIVEEMSGKLQRHTVGSEELAEEIGVDEPIMKACKSPSKQQVIDAALTERIRMLLRVAERYPDVSTEDRFKDLAASLEQVADEAEIARRRYQKASREFNSRVNRFPERIIANLFGFEEQQVSK